MAAPGQICKGGTRPRRVYGWGSTLSLGEAGSISEAGSDVDRMREGVRNLTISSLGPGKQMSLTPSHPSRTLPLQSHQ